MKKKKEILEIFEYILSKVDDYNSIVIHKYHFNLEAEIRFEKYKFYFQERGNSSFELIIKLSDNEEIDRCFIDDYDKTQYLRNEIVNIKNTFIEEEKDIWNKYKKILIRKEKLK
jgi:hypothetical protein